VLLVAGQPRQPVQHRARTFLGLRREVHADGHVTAQHLRLVPVDVLPTAETGVAFDSFHWVKNLLCIYPHSRSRERVGVRGFCCCLCSRLRGARAALIRPSGTFSREREKGNSLSTGSPSGSTRPSPSARRPR